MAKGRDSIQKSPSPIAGGGDWHRCDTRERMWSEMDLMRERRTKDAYMNSAIQNMFMRGQLRKDHPLQRKPDQWDKQEKDGLIVTVLKGEDIDSIKVCEQLTEKGVVLWVIDGIQRLTVLNSYQNGTFKLGKSIECPIFQYQRVRTDCKGKILKDGQDNYVYEIVEIDLRGKGYEDLPVELKEKFDNYKIDVVKHLDCSEDEIGYHIRRYNRQRSMNASQYAVTYMDNMAGAVKQISLNHRFFREYDIYTEREISNGTIERIVIESVMCMYHLDHWQKQSRRIGAYLNEFSRKEEFERLSDNLDRLGDIYREEFRPIFTSGESYIWFTLFDRFTALPFSDKDFADFLAAYQGGLCSAGQEAGQFNGIDAKKPMKDKAAVEKRLRFLETQMHEFLHIKKKDLKEQDLFRFIQVNVNRAVTREDLEQYEEVLEDLTMKVDHASRLLDRRNRPSMTALVAYSFDADIDLDDWIIDYFGRNHSFLLDQRENFIRMREDLDCFEKRKARRQPAAG